MEYHEIKFTINNTIIATIYSNKNHILVKQIKCIIFIQNLFSASVSNDNHKILVNNTQH